jgi:hypothetical protein
MKTSGEVELELHHFSLLNYIEVCDQLHDPAALLQLKSHWNPLDKRVG